VCLRARARACVRGVSVCEYVSLSHMWLHKHTLFCLPDIYGNHQNLELGPLETPLRSVVVRLNNGALWVHAPLAPTEEYFELVESCADGAGRGAVAHVVIPTYALEHKVFAKDALERWPNAQLWVAPGQFSFPFPSVPDAWVFGRAARCAPHYLMKWRWVCSTFVRCEVAPHDMMARCQACH